MGAFALNLSLVGKGASLFMKGSLMWDVVAFGCDLRGRVAEGVASYRKVLHLQIQPLISTFDLSCICGGGRVQQMALKAEQVTARGASARSATGRGLRAVPSFAEERAVPLDGS